MSAFKIIAIDGPSSSGKGTIAKLVAQKLKFNYLDSGAIYRTLALLVIRKAVDPTNISQVITLTSNMNLSFHDNGVFIDDEDISSQIRSEQVGMMASQLGKNEQIRHSLLEFQRSFANGANLVTDGRDMGSIVFPYADLKIFLTATATMRAERRYKQLQLWDKSVKMESILRDIIARDKQDSERSVAPLAFSGTYKLLDNTNLSIEESVNQVISWYYSLV